jgi:hypothetical protein
VLQAAISDCVSFDPFSFQQDGLGASEVDVSRGEIAQAPVIAAMVVVIDERVDLGLEVAGQIIVLKQDAVLECLMPALDAGRRVFSLNSSAAFMMMKAELPIRSCAFSRR